MPRIAVELCARVLYSTRLLMEGLRPMPKHAEEHLRILLRRNAIERRIREMGRQISRDFRGERVHLIGVLKGASIFLSDLIRNIRLEASLDFMAVSSYGKANQTSGQVRLTKDLDTSIEGLNVILVEDILDTGLTLNYLHRVLMQRRPRVLRIAALLDKPERRIKEVRADYIGFKIPNEDVVGDGLDYAERYRNLKDVCVLSLPDPVTEAAGNTSPQPQVRRKKPRT
jgi:hypoxanthine phosphoribosyltransferase